ncbi:MAG: hypothetical protein ACREIT_10925, partial [Tepidisphaeraceae bacterium]
VSDGKEDARPCVPTWEPRHPVWLGLLTALVLSLLVAAPWYVVQHLRFTDFAAQMFGGNVVHRLTVGYDPASRHGPGFLWRQVHETSGPFELSALGFAFALLCCFVGTRRREFRLIAFVPVAWLAMFTVSTSKYAHYVYPALPFVAIAIASMGEAGLRVLRNWGRARPWLRYAWIVGLVLAIGALSSEYVKIFTHRIADRPDRCAVWDAYRAFAPAVEAGEARVVVVGFGATPLQWERSVPTLSTSDSFYLRRMRATEFADSAGLERVLDERRPTLAVVRRDEAPALGRGGARLDERFRSDQPGYTVIGIDSLAIPDPAGRTRLKPLANP